MALAILAVILPIVGVGLILGAPIGGGEAVMYIVGGILVIAGPLCGLGSYACLKSNFRCHEWGVYQVA